MSARISIIVAMSRVGQVIGTADNRLPWKNIPEDMSNFRELTTPHPILMGRKTWESLGKTALPRRTNIVITRDPGYDLEDKSAFIANSLKKALEMATTVDRHEVFIIGGGKIFEAALPLATRLYLTLVDVNVDGPVTFPVFNRMLYETVLSRPSSDENYHYEFLVLDRAES